MLLPFAVESYREEEERAEHAWITYTLIVLCLLAHIGLVSLSPATRTDLYFRLGVVKHTFKWYTPLTCAFLHGGWLHLLGNMLFLWVFGASLERLLGRGRFLITYLIGAGLSVALHLATLPDTAVHLPAIGASGAISAVLGAFFVLLPKAKLKCVFIFFLRPLIGTLPVWLVLGFWFIIQLYMSADPLASTGGVAFWAHVGGFCAGALLAGYWDFELKRNRMNHRQKWCQPLAAAWTAWLENRFSEAADYYQQALAAGEVGIAGEDPLLAALVGMKTGTMPVEEILRNMERLDMLLDATRVIMLYRELVKTVPVDQIPASIHRQAGKNALSRDLPELALRAFARAFEREPDLKMRENQDVLRRAAAAARHKMNNPALADSIATFCIEETSGVLL